jgi:hypothetical protein
MSQGFSPYERYTIGFAKASDYLLRKDGKSMAHRHHDLKRIADIGRYPWDVVQ